MLVSSSTSRLRPVTMSFDVHTVFELVLYIRRISPAPTLPPAHVRVTLIEADTALVSWKPPDQPTIAVTHYTVLYASRQAWIAGEWQVLHREGEERVGR